MSPDEMREEIVDLKNELATAKRQRDDTDELCRALNTDLVEAQAELANLKILLDPVAPKNVSVFSQVRYLKSRLRHHEAAAERLQAEEDARTAWIYEQWGLPKQEKKDE